jgi:hypothetical protein
VFDLVEGVLVYVVGCEREWGILFYAPKVMYVKNDE